MGVTDDPDLGSRSAAAPPTQSAAGAVRRPPLLAVIFVGGALGTVVRALLEDVAPARPGAVPWTTLAINVVGSLLLGLLLETLARTGPDEGWRRTARLGLGTGVLGGFTTYSTFAVETVDRLAAQTLLVGLAYAVCSVAGGLAAAAVGYRLARRLAHRLGRSAPAGEASR